MNTAFRVLCAIGMLVGAVAGQLLHAFRVRIERFAQDPTCPRCGEDLDHLERYTTGWCFDCDVVALASGDMTYEHFGRVSELVRAA